MHHWMVMYPVLGSGQPCCVNMQCVTINLANFPCPVVVFSFAGAIFLHCICSEWGITYDNDDSKFRKQLSPVRPAVATEIGNERSEHEETLSRHSSDRKWINEFCCKIIENIFI